MSNLKRDQNHVPVAGGVYDDGSNTIAPLQINASNGRLKCTAILAGGSGTVTTVSVVSANGFAGTVANASTTPAITLTTSVTGLLKGNGTAISAASDGTDYLSPSTGITTGQGTSQTIGDTTHRLTKLWATDITCTNAISGSVTGNAGTVTNATLTTALTVNTGAVTLTGNVAGSTLTLGAGSSSVSGSNTGDQDLSGYLLKSTYDANTILYATTDNTPVALTVGEQTVVGRATGGAISALTIDSDLSSVSANDDTIPSAKATKAMGDLKLALAGGTMSGNITLGENTAIALDSALSADGKYTGIVRAGTAGATLAFGDLVYLAAADSRWELADADAASTAGDVILGMCVQAAANDGDATTILLYGNIRADAAFPTLTIGAQAYVSTTAGDIQTAQPSGTDDVIRVVGYGLSADELLFNPSSDYVTHT